MPKMIDASLRNLVMGILDSEEFKYALLAAADDWRKMTNAIETVPSREGCGYDAKYIDNLLLHGTRGAIDNALVDTVVQLAGNACDEKRVMVEDKSEEAEDAD